MSIARFAKRRDAAEPEIVEALRKIGARVWQQDRPVDLLVGFHGRLVGLEVKNPGARPRKDQAEQRETIESAQRDGLPFYYVSTIDDALNAVAGLHLASWH